MTPSILVARHGETTWNTKGLVQGQHDIPLNKTGRLQAERLGIALADTPLRAIYSSPLSRAKETAEIVQTMVAEGRGEEIPIEIEPSIAERAFGPLEGKVLKSLAPDEIAFLQQVDGGGPEGIEPLGTFTARVLDFFDRLKEELSRDHPDGNMVLVVTHMGVIRSLYKDILGMAMREKARNCALHEIEVSAVGFSLVNVRET
jgi:probable phosphoglycerate mutase